MNFCQREISIFPPRGRYSTDVLVGRCGWGAHTLTLFKTEISNFSTLFKTTSRFLRPRLNTLNQKSLSSFVVVQASGIGANKKAYKFGILYHFYKFKCTCFQLKCDTLFKTKSDEIDIPFKTENPENHTLSGRTSPLRSYMGVPPRDFHILM